jgi:hypothetical protein
MSKDEGFLARWSRRKREQADVGTAPEHAPPVAEEAAGEVGAGPPEGGRIADDEEREDDRFDPASLPPLDSIVADTDIRAFLAPGVPAALKQAALRRAWSADPTIRDFVGLSENAWDFNAPGGVPGFGPLQMGDKLRRFVLDTMTGEGQPAAPTVAAPAGGATAAEKTVAESDSAEGAPEGAAADAVLPVAPRESANTQESGAGSSAAENMNTELNINVGANSRGHGGALPR